MIQEKQTTLKDFPPIRNITNNQFLWECLKLKLIDNVSSKHAFINTHYKYTQEGSFKRALNGVNTLGCSL